MTPLTLHRSLENFHNDPRVAFPFTLRNFYYPKIGNEDLWEFKKVKLSYYSKFRKILGNPYLSPFRTLNQKEKYIKIIKKNKNVKKDSVSSFTTGSNAYNFFKTNNFF